MQALGIGSLLMCVVCMFALFLDEAFLGKVLFGISLVLMMGSLILSLREIVISVNALTLELKKTGEVFKDRFIFKKIQKSDTNIFVNNKNIKYFDLFIVRK